MFSEIGCAVFMLGWVWFRLGKIELGMVGLSQVRMGWIRLG